jgi:hypothetical protein
MERRFPTNCDVRRLDGMHDNLTLTQGSFMPNTASPTQAIFTPPTDTDVQWFGESQRLIGGEPDSRYGWLQRGDEVYIVKAISPDLTAYAGTLLQHERAMLRRLADINAPVPHMLDVGRDDWLVTHFGGLSLQRLTHAGGLQGLAPLPRFGFAERLAAWVHLLRRLQPVADKGVLVIDLYSANVVVPLTATLQGQLRLHEAALIDHAHTVEAGMDMRRPVWLNHDMARLAPELSGTMKADMAVLKAAFAKAGAALPGYSKMPGQLDGHSRRVWAQYDAPQKLQKLLDQGSLNRDHAMQFAAGVVLRPLQVLCISPRRREKLEVVLKRMTAADASQRYPTLAQAADALAQVVDALPLVSQHSYARLQPIDLSTPNGSEPLPEPVPDPEPDSTTLAAIFIDPNPAPTPGTDQQPQPHLPTAFRPAPMLYLYAAAAMGAALGTVWPGLW